MGRNACSCLPAWLLPRPGRFARSKAEDTTASAAYSAASRGAAPQDRPPSRAATTPVPQARPGLAQGYASSSLFRAATSVRGRSRRRPTTAARISRCRSELARGPSGPPEADGGTKPCTKFNAPSKGSYLFLRRNPHSNASQKQCMSPKQSHFTVNRWYSTLHSTPHEGTDEGQVQEPYAIKIRFGRLFDIPVTKEGDKVELRTFCCFVCFEHEDPAAAAADPRRCTRSHEGFYSGCTHYEVPLGGEVVEVCIPRRSTDGLEDAEKKNSRRTNTVAFMDEAKQSTTTRVLSLTGERAVVAAAEDLHADFHTPSHHDQATKEEGEDISPRARDTAPEAAEEEAKDCDRRKDQNVTGTHRQQTGTRAGLLRVESRPAQVTAPIRGFHVGVIEQSQQGDMRDIKGITTLLSFSDPKLLEPRKWPMMSFASTARTAAGTIYMRCQLVHAIPAPIADTGPSSHTRVAPLETNDGARSDVADAGTSPSAAGAASAKSPATASEIVNLPSGTTQENEAILKQKSAGRTSTD